MRYFTKGDWSGYCGAEEAEDGRQPQISEKEFPLDVELIVDRNGLAVSYDGTEAGFECSYDEGLQMAKKMEDQLMEIKSFNELVEKLDQMGFNRL